MIKTCLIIYLMGCLFSWVYLYFSFIKECDFDFSLLELIFGYLFFTFIGFPFAIIFNTIWNIKEIMSN